MTTHAQTLSRRKRGNVAGAAARSAEARRCPKCDRKAALVRVKDAPPGEVSSYCRWCDYARIRPSPDELMLPSAPMAAPKNPRGGRPARSGEAATDSVKLRLTPAEVEAFGKAAAAAGFTMPRTKEHPETRGAIGAWLRSLGNKAIGGS